MYYLKIYSFFWGFLLVSVEYAHCMHPDDHRQENEHQSYHDAGRPHSHTLDNHILLNDPQEQAFFRHQSLFRLTSLPLLHSAGSMFKSVFLYFKETFQAVVTRSFSRPFRDNFLQAQRPLATSVHLPHDVRVYILSLLIQQKDLLSLGTVSKDWRKAAEKVWEKRPLDLSNKQLTEADYKSLAGGIFPHLTLDKVGLDEEGMNILATGSHLQSLELCDNNLRAMESLIKLLSLSHLSSIRLWNNSIGDEGAKAVAEALSRNRTLTKVGLGCNRIGDEGAKAIAEALVQNRTLTTFYLGSNSIDYEGAKAIAGALSQNRTLTTVDLSYNRIGDEGAKAIAGALSQNTTLTTVYLDSNSIDYEGAKAIAGALHENKTLMELNLRSNRFGDEGAKTIAEVLSQNRMLAAINLGCNKIGNEGAKAIAGALTHNRTLAAVNLDYNKIGDEGAKAITAALHENKTLMELNLRSNRFGDEATKEIEAILHENKTLTSIYLSRNRISDESKKA